MNELIRWIENVAKIEYAEYIYDEIIEICYSIHSKMVQRDFEFIKKIEREIGWLCIICQNFGDMRTEYKLQLDKIRKELECVIVQELEL